MKKSLHKILALQTALEKAVVWDGEKQRIPGVEDGDLAERQYTKEP